MTNVVGPPGGPHERAMPPSGERPDNNEERIIDQLLTGLPKENQAAEPGIVRIHATTIPNPNAPLPEGDWREVVGAVSDWEGEPRRLEQLVVNWGHRAPKGSDEESFHSRLHIQHGPEGLTFSTQIISEGPNGDKSVDEHPDTTIGPDNIDVVSKEIDRQVIQPFSEQPPGPQSPAS